ncbi:MAG TPA: carboxypeptidase M32, partial [Ardenticatenaceae bacterium]|nr:carboxypeptidase M32 [Ardenticatenaceae bacterium]
MEARFAELKQRLVEINDLNSASQLLSWDQSTYMPPGGAPARARQLATLGRLAQEKFTDAAIGRLLEELGPYEESLPYDSPEASLIRVTRHDYELAVRVPPEFTGKFLRHLSATYEAWTRARPANDFAAVRPLLETTVAMTRELAGFFPGHEHIADPLIDFADPGMKASTLHALFAELREGLVPLVHAITSQPIPDDACLRQTFPENKQIEFATEMVGHIGYDFERGRQDKSPHPFMTKFSLGDVRITTRVRENDVGEAIFIMLHEAGHALYEQGINRGFEGTPLAGGTSAGVHESQSRLWENLVGRSRGFWSFFYPRLQAAFPEQLGAVPSETFYRAVNKVERSVIRTDADEVTYNLHVMMRFDFELALLEGHLEVRDLPEAWRARLEKDLGVAPPDDRDGVLQDMHWFSGPVGGAFQGYTLGNILSSQLFDTAIQAHPEIPTEIEAGR